MKTALLVIATMLTINSFAQTGLWKIEKGMLPNGSTYTGTINVSQIKNTYKLDWKTSTGNYSGVGILADGKIFAGYGLDKGAYGIVVYKSNSEKKNFEGVWTTNQLGGSMGTETLLATSEKGLFEVIGKNADNSVYKGQLAMNKTGDCYQVQWKVANSTYNGVAFTSGDYLVIGFGFGQQFGLVEYLIMGGKATGRWAMGGGNTLGTENITR